MKQGLILLLFLFLLSQVSAAIVSHPIKTLGNPPISNTTTLPWMGGSNVNNSRVDSAANTRVDSAGNTRVTNELE